jgi:hypothetical protein
MKFAAIFAPLLVLALSTSATPSSSFEKRGGYGYTPGLASKGFANILKTPAAPVAAPYSSALESSQVLEKRTYKVCVLISSYTQGGVKGYRRGKGGYDRMKGGYGGKGGYYGGKRFGGKGGYGRMKGGRGYAKGGRKQRYYSKTHTSHIKYSGGGYGGGKKGGGGAYAKGGQEERFYSKTHTTHIKQGSSKSHGGVGYLESDDA